jgi:hypothetical protein
MWAFFFLEIVIPIPSFLFATFTLTKDNLFYCIICIQQINALPFFRKLSSLITSLFYLEGDITMAVFKRIGSVRYLQYPMLLSITILLLTSLLSCSDLEHHNINDPENAGFENSGRVEFTISNVFDTPINDCYVLFDDGDYVTTTFENGQASFPLSVGEHLYLIKKYGYKEVSGTFSISYNNTTSIPVELNGIPVIDDNSVNIETYFHDMPGTDVYGVFGFKLSFLFDDPDGVSDINAIILTSPVESEEDVVLNPDIGQNSIETILDLGTLTGSDLEVLPYIENPYILTIFDNQGDSSITNFQIESFFRVKELMDFFTTAQNQSSDSLIFRWYSPRSGNPSLFWFPIVNYRIEVLDPNGAIAHDTTFVLDHESPLDSVICYVQLNQVVSYDWRLTLYDPFRNSTRSNTENFSVAD